MSEQKSSAGKGSKPRPFSDYKQYAENFEEIKGFGFKPKWKEENERKQDIQPENKQRGS